MRRWVLGMILSLLASISVGADLAGKFDYYVLSLSWSPNWCDRSGIAQGSEQCTSDRDLGWILHGLWPQFEAGWPSYCETAFEAPNDQQTSEMVDIMGSEGLARYEWDKHGTCSGLDSAQYFKTSRNAYGSVVRPLETQNPEEMVRISANRVEAEFLRVNPHLKADQVTVTCTSNQIQEVRICLTKELRPRDCGADVIRDCTLKNAVFHPIP